jgi:hypothetical protein
MRVSMFSLYSEFNAPYEDRRPSEVGKEIKHDKRVKSEINTHCRGVPTTLCNNIIIIYELRPLYHVRHTLYYSRQS